MTDDVSVVSVCSFKFCVAELVVELCVDVLLEVVACEAIIFLRCVYKIAIYKYTISYIDQPYPITQPVVLRS